MNGAEIITTSIWALDARSDIPVSLKIAAVSTGKAWIG